MLTVGCLLSRRQEKASESLLSKATKGNTSKF
jgi:hypothetical protein